jgi:hypothetical protein
MPPGLQRVVQRASAEVYIAIISKKEGGCVYTVS